jgi:hypothetical protein
LLTSGTAVLPEIPSFFGEFGRTGRFLLSTLRLGVYLACILLACLAGLCGPRTGGACSVGAKRTSRGSQPLRCGYAHTPTPTQSGLRRSLSWNRIMHGPDAGSACVAAFTTRLFPFAARGCRSVEKLSSVSLVQTAHHVFFHSFPRNAPCFVNRCFVNRSYFSFGPPS